MSEQKKTEPDSEFEEARLQDELEELARIVGVRPPMGGELVARWKRAVVLAALATVLVGQKAIFKA